MFGLKILVRVQTFRRGPPCPRTTSATLHACSPPIKVFKCVFTIYDWRVSYLEKLKKLAQWGECRPEGKICNGQMFNPVSCYTSTTILAKPCLQKYLSQSYDSNTAKKHHDFEQNPGLKKNSSCKLQSFEFQEAHALQGLFNLYALAKQMVPCDPFARKREGKPCSAVH